MLNRPRWNRDTPYQRMPLPLLPPLKKPKAKTLPLKPQSSQTPPLPDPTKGAQKPIEKGQSAPYPEQQSGLGAAPSLQ